MIKRAAAGLRRRHPLQAHATTPGTSASAWSPTATSSRRSRGGSAEIVTDRIETFTESGIELESGRRARGRRRRHRDRPQPALPRRHEARRRRRASRTCREPSTYKGMMLERRPQLRLHARLHQRLLDAEGRPHLRIRLPPAQPHGRAAATRVCVPDVDRPLGHRGAAARLQLRLRPALARPAAQTGLEGAVETAPELPGRPADAAPRPDRRRHDAVLQPGAARRQPETQALASAS